MQHRRRTGPGALVPTRWGAAARSGLGVLLACCALGGTALAAAGGAQRDVAADVVQIARQQLGDTYAWGGNGPDAWDCSGLTSRLWREVGGVKDIPRVSRDQQAWAVPIPAEQLLVGDLVFFGNPVTHVALYAGDGRIVDASSSKAGVVERKIWTSGVIRYGRVPRQGMPAVAPWTPPVLPSPSPTATTGTTTAAASASPRATTSAKPTASTKPTASAKPTASPAPASPAPASTGLPVAALATEPLRGLPARDLPAATAVADRAVNNARSVRGSRAWTDLELIRGAWRHAGGGLLPKDRAGVVAGGAVVPVDEARIGDVIAYGAPATHLGLYMGHGYMVDTSRGYVVVRRVYASPTVRVVRLSVVK